MTGTGGLVVADPSHQSQRLAYERREFGKVLIAQGASTLGSQFALVALPLATYVVTGSAAAAGVVGVVNALSRTVTAVISGPVADRFNQVTVMIMSDVGRLASNLLLFWIVLARPTDSLILLCLLVAVEGVLSTLFLPCETIVVCRIVAAERLPDRLARSQSVSWAAALVGPPIGGLLFAVGPALPFLGNAASYLVSAVFVAALRLRRDLEAGQRQAPRGPLSAAELVAGVRFVVRDRFLRQALLQVALHNVALGALSIIVLVGAQQRGVSGVAIGILVGAQAFGALVGSVCTVHVLRRVSAGQVVLLTGWSWVALLPAIVAIGHWIALSVLLALMWFLAPIQRTVIGTYQGQRVPPEILGRVNSAVSLLAGSLAALGPGLGGQLLTEGNLALSIGCLLALTVPPLLLSTFVARIGDVSIKLERKLSD